jgi:protein NRD1
MVPINFEYVALPRLLSTHANSLQTKWGVGFGPRDCSDYQTGISVIPIDRLTDADRKWMLTGEYGGTGGKPLEWGMVVEEPDIEIGAGVSSKGTSSPHSLLRDQY